MATKNPNYESSAERLTNPESVRLLLLTRLGLNSKLNELQKELDTRNQDLLRGIFEVKEVLADNESKIWDAVHTDGGYQDVDAGLYALRQREVSYSYDPKAFRQRYPEYAPAVIKEVVDTDKLNGLLRSGLLKMEELPKPVKIGLRIVWVARAKVSFTFIIKAEPIKEGK